MTRPKKSGGPARYPRIGLFAVSLCLACLAAGCSAAPSGINQASRTIHHRATTSGVTGPTTSSAPATPPSTMPVGAPTTATIPGLANALTLLVEPQDGMNPIYTFMSAARHSLDMTMYELSDPMADQILIADHDRGVRVRVLLDRDYSGGSVNRAAYTALAAAGVPVAWADDSEIFHQKTITDDGTESAIMTGNLTSQYYPTTRDFVVMDRQAADVAAVEAAFEADWSGAPPSGGSPGDDLVWSPGSANRLTALIGSAHHSVVVENEEMDSAPVEGALEGDAGRGVNVTVIMTAGSERNSAFARLESSGVHVVLYPDTSTVLYIHAKVIDVDSATAFIGSENFSTASLDYNRELGVITSLASVLGPLNSTLLADASGGQRQPVGASAPIAAPAPTPAPTAPSLSTTTGCYIDPEGNCYRAGEYCPDRLHGQSVAGQDGPIACEERSGTWYWEPA